MTIEIVKVVDGVLKNMGTRHWSESIPFNVLLRLALANYNHAIQQNFIGLGLNDLPTNAGFALASIDRDGTLFGDLVETLGASKQVTSVLINALIDRGCVIYSHHAGDRRRRVIKLTADGHAAAVSARLTLHRQDDILAKRVGADFVFHTRVTLGSIIENAPGYNRLRYFRNNL